jgi:YesN/AraC family two-component response regulator
MDEHQYILIVDDDERVLFVLSQALRALEDGYCVETAQSGEEALEKALVRPYDILITDIVMPGMNGVELTEAIEDLHPDTRVIWITAHGRHRFRADSVRLHVHQYLEKPIRVAEIRQAVLDVAKQAES